MTPIRTNRKTSLYRQTSKHCKEIVKADREKTYWEQLNLNDMDLLRLVSPNRRWPCAKATQKRAMVLSWSTTRLGPPHLNHTRERAGGFQPWTHRYNKYCPFPPHPVAPRARPREPPMQPGKGQGQCNSHKNWAGHAEPRFHPRLGLPYPSPGDSLGSQFLLESEAHPGGEGRQLSAAAGAHGTCVTNPFSVELPPWNAAPASIFSGHLPLFAQFSKCWVTYTSSKTDFSKQVQHQDTFRQTKAILVYDHQTHIRGTSKGYSSGKGK